MATRRIFLHIGAIKTGTTYIQSVLRENRERLVEEGVLFPGRVGETRCARWRTCSGSTRSGTGGPRPLHDPGRALSRRFGPSAATRRSCPWSGSRTRACPGAVDRVVTGPRRGPGGAHAPGRDGHRAGGLADRRAQRIDGLVAPVRPWGPSRAALPVDLGAVRAARGGRGCSPAPRTRATSCGRGQGSWERRGSTWSRCLPRGSRRSCCGHGSRRRSGSRRSCAGRRSHRPTLPWGWRRRELLRLVNAHVKHLAQVDYETTLKEHLALRVLVPSPLLRAVDRDGSVHQPGRPAVEPADPPCRDRQRMQGRRRPC